MRKQYRIGRRARTAVAVAGASLLAVTAAACSSSSSSSAGGNSSGKVTITEFDYFTSSGNDAALNWYNAQFMKAHPDITVKRTSVPYANLITKILQDASAGDMPNLMLIDNPNVPEVAVSLHDVPTRSSADPISFLGELNSCGFV
jgi:ABC-type glycerol-3-phosphate transport system substrate-binding protein